MLTRPAPRGSTLSRTAKKAARISLTTDTLEMMTCELNVRPKTRPHRS